MKIDKALGNLMLSTLGQSMANISTISNKECVVISLWSGSELNTTERDAIKTSVDANGLIPGNWTANFTGRTELARLTLTNFINRYIGNDLDIDWTLSNRGEQFVFLNAGNCSAFSMYVCNNSFAGYAAAAGNTGRMLLVGTTTDMQGNGDLKLNSVAITNQSRIRIPDIKLLFDYANYVNTWTASGGAGTGPEEEQFWSQTLFLAKFDGNGLEEKSSTQMAVTAGTASYTATPESATVGDQSLVLNGSTWTDFSNYSLTAHAPGTGDFTLEVFTTLGVTTGLRELLADALASQSGIRPVIQIDATNRRVQYAHGTTVLLNSALNCIHPNKLAHIAIQRRGTDLEMYVNGRRLSRVTNSEDILLSTLRVGLSTVASAAYVGSVGSVRYTKGVARYNGKGFYPSLQQFDRLLQEEAELDHSNTVFEVDFGVAQKDLVSDLPLITAYTESLSAPVVDGEAVFGGSSGLTINKIGFGLGSAFTIEGFVTPGEGQVGSGCLFGIGPSFTWSSMVYINSTDLYFADTYNRVYFANQPGLPARSANLDTGVESHVALVYDGTNFMAFVNGRKVTSVPSTYTHAAGDQKIWFGSGYGYGFKGSIRAVRVSNVARYTEDFIPNGRFRR